MLSNKDALLVLNGLPHVGPVLLRRLLDSFGGDPVAVLSGSMESLTRVRGIGPHAAQALMDWEAYFDLEREKEKIGQYGAVFLERGHVDYPMLLKEMYDPPIGLYWLGGYKVDRPCVAIVGTRQASMYGLKVARKFGAELAGLGFCVVSGMARGIDTAAHEGALEGGGPTLAVLGCGLVFVKIFFHGRFHSGPVFRGYKYHLACFLNCYRWAVPLLPYSKVQNGVG